MARPRRYTAAEALQRILQIDDDAPITDEDDTEEYDNTVFEEEQEDVAAAGDVEIDNDDEGDIEILSDEESDTNSEVSDDEANEVIANNIVYSNIPFQARRRDRNIVQPRNQTAHPQSELEAFNLFLSEPIIREVLRCTNRKVTDFRRSVPVVRGYMTHFSYDEICACLGILLRAGLDRDNLTDLPELWNPKEGRPFYRAVTSLQRMQFFLRCIRFDNFRNRAQRQLVNRLAAISEVWDQFNSNLRRPYSPGETLAVDEQLLGYRGNIPGRTYLPSKPAKYGLKIFWLAEAITGYALNAKIYSGRLPNEPPHTKIGRDVVLDLTRPFYQSGRDIITDNYFTSHELAVTLLANGLTLLGTIRGNRREIPTNIKTARQRDVQSSIFLHDHENKIILASYVPRRKKNVLMLSSSHSGKEVAGVEHKHKPLMILDYNKGKGAVDQLDENLAEFTCKRKTVRWPLLVWYNMLDVAAYNGYLLRKFDMDALKRRDYLKKLTYQLVYRFACQRQANKNLPTESKQAAEILGFRIPNPAVIPLNDTSVRGCFVCKHNTRSKCEVCLRAICPNHRIFVKSTKCQYC